MEKIKIVKDGGILAHHTTETPLSHYWQAVWIVLDEDPSEGPAIFRQGDNQLDIEILEVIGGWLVIRQPDKNLAGIIWSDGKYFADLLEDPDGNPVQELADDSQVRNTMPMGKLGSVLF